MKKTAYILVTLIGILSIGCSNSGGNKGRYQLVSSPYTINGNTYIGMRMLDTYTGVVWGYTGFHKDQDSNWTYLGDATKLNLK